MKGWILITLVLVVMISMVHATSYPPAMQGVKMSSYYYTGGVMTPSPIGPDTYGAYYEWDGEHAYMLLECTCKQ